MTDISVIGDQERVFYADISVIGEEGLVIYADISVIGDTRLVFYADISVIGTERVNEWVETFQQSIYLYPLDSSCGLVSD
jgi:hypothetical protein